MNTLIQRFKANLKAQLLVKLHAEPAITSQLATKIILDGVPRFLNWSYSSEKNRVLHYLDSLRTGEFEYKFCTSAPGPCLYSSIYACMLLGMFGELDAWPMNKMNKWLEFFNSFQCQSDGHFRDPVLDGEAYEGNAIWGDGWGVRHLAGHIIIAYSRLGGLPRYSFSFLEPYFDSTYLEQWLKGFDFSNNVWSQSNYIMNIFVLLQFIRDRMNEDRANKPLQQIRDWLLKTQRTDTGMWHKYDITGYPELGDAIRGAYHFYPLFVYEGQDVPHKEKVIDIILSSQNSWGGFNPPNMPSGACEDIDALEPLVRFSKGIYYRQKDIHTSLQRAFVWIQSCAGNDGGYTSIPLNACHYGDHPYTTSGVGESNMFATWFRSLCLAYVVGGLNLKNSYQIGHFPGYEIRL